MVKTSTILILECKFLTRSSEQAQIRNCNGSSSGALFHHKTATALTPVLPDTSAPTPLLKV